MQWEPVKLPVLRKEQNKRKRRQPPLCDPGTLSNEDLRADKNPLETSVSSYPVQEVSTASLPEKFPL